MARHEISLIQRINDPTLTDLLSLSTLTLATTARDGTAHAAPLYFASDQDLRLYFFSTPDSQHAQHLEGNPEAAAAIYPECWGWQEIRGLQLRGKALLVEPGAAREAAWRLYAAKFPFVHELESALSRNHLYVFIPEWIRLVDNQRGFGFKLEWTLP